MKRPGALPVKSIGAVTGDLPEPPAGLPVMYWVSFNVEVLASSIAVSPKINPIIIQGIEGQVRLRRSSNGGASWVFGDKSDLLGPGTGNQPVGLQSSVSTVAGVTNIIEVKVFSSDLGSWTDSEWEEILSYTPTGVGGPFEIPIVA